MQLKHVNIFAQIHNYEIIDKFFILAQILFINVQTENRKYTAINWIFLADKLNLD